METASIKLYNDPDGFPLNQSHTKSFLVAVPNSICNNSNNQRHSNNNSCATIEMFAFQCVAYTSLKDLMPSSPQSVTSPMSSRKESWREIPIKDPLVQHAAWAYLQPIGALPDADGRNLVEKLKDRCCGLFGCFSDVVLVIVKNLCGFKEDRTTEVDEEKDD